MPIRIYPDTKTVDTEHEDLGTAGYDGALNDRVFKYLGDQGYTGNITDRLNANSITPPDPVVMYDTSNASFLIFPQDRISALDMSSVSFLNDPSNLLLAKDITVVSFLT